MKLIFATHNQNKIEEIRATLDPHVELISLNELQYFDDIPETFHTLEENAVQKARFIYDKFGIETMADDTGLEVEALNGAPGVMSARYAGPMKNSNHNIIKLLKDLENEENLKARFRTIIALVNQHLSKTFQGIVEGRIIRTRKGSGGFGYDPVFVPDGHTRTFAQMTLKEKNQISHRARAIQSFSSYLKQRMNLNNT